jgi:hypothetical protein
MSPNDRFLLHLLAGRRIDLGHVAFHEEHLSAAERTRLLSGVFGAEISR